MKLIIKYKIFESSEDFEKWQESNNIYIHQIIPCALRVHNTFSNSLITESIPEYTQGEWLMGVLVTYHDEAIDEIPS